MRSLSTMMFLQYAVWGVWLLVLPNYLVATPADGGLGFTSGQVGWILGFALSIGAVLTDASSIGHFIWENATELVGDTDFYVTFDGTSWSDVGGIFGPDRDAFAFELQDNSVVIPLPTSMAMGLAGLGLVALGRRRR